MAEKQGLRTADVRAAAFDVEGCADLAAGRRDGQETRQGPEIAPVQLSVGVSGYQPASEKADTGKECVGTAKREEGRDSHFSFLNGMVLVPSESVIFN